MVSGLQWYLLTGLKLPPDGIADQRPHILDRTPETGGKICWAKSPRYPIFVWIGWRNLNSPPGPKRARRPKGRVVGSGLPNRPYHPITTDIRGHSLVRERSPITEVAIYASVLPYVPNSPPYNPGWPRNHPTPDCAPPEVIGVTAVSGVPRRPNK